MQFLKERLISNVDMICEKQNCYGCSACFNICPQNCISMVPDEEGFLYPFIDQTNCIDCKMCISVCQVHNDMSRTLDIQKYYAVKNNDTVRVNSSSGGMFTAISDYILTHNGVIVGAILKSDFTVSHILVNDIKGRNLLRGTKYVQSNLKNIFSEIQEILIKGKKVLFVGTPCQVEGLNLFLGKIYDNLITCDLVCHGVSSPKIFKSFIDYIQEKGKDKLVKFNFKDKELGWRRCGVSAEYKNKRIKNTLWLRSFNYLFSQNYINRPSCSRCKYVSYNRCSDITIGDYWGIERYYPEFEDQLGVSLVLVNTEKGEKLYQRVSQNLVQIEVKREETKQNSLSRLPKPNKQRESFWDYYNKFSYKIAIKKFGEYNFKGYVKNIARKMIYVLNISGHLSKYLKDCWKAKTNKFY